MIDVESYCRDLEAYLCRKNDGHLIRIAGPSFERVMGWATQGIPLSVAQAGVDRYFERYYRRGPRRRPVRIDFCEADVLDAYDAWRRAVGVARVTPGPEGASAVETQAPGRPRRSLASHIEAAVTRLTALRASTQAGPMLGDALEGAVRALDPLVGEASRARGAARDALLQRLADADRALVVAAVGALPADRRQAFDADAARELESFRPRMSAEAYDRSREAAVGRLARLYFGLPDIEPD